MGGTLVIASVGAMIRLGLGDVLYLGEVVAAALMFVGLILVTERAPASAAAERARA